MYTLPGILGPYVSNEEKKLWINPGAAAQLPLRWDGEPLPDLCNADFAGELGLEWVNNCFL